MFIKEIILDGFKSYANHTTVTDFDPSFNAIRGFNGHGKSNMLDAICFVLGITSLKELRVDKLSQLIYKEGQAGITKASVTIVFDNRERSKSPLGYEENEEITVTRQIQIQGRNKYLINGHVAQPQRVQNLFHSVQLNVNNPHFLIKQGGITRVLNMKPQEYLQLIEEAAGTRMYEVKKANAIKTMEKKEEKLVEIDSILEEEITPTLDKLRTEKASYEEWMSNKREIESLDRYVVAHRFHGAAASVESAGESGRQSLLVGGTAVAATPSLVVVDRPILVTGAGLAHEWFRGLRRPRPRRSVVVAECFCDLFIIALLTPPVPPTTLFFCLLPFFSQ